jgi:hypothetical protein
MTTQDFRDIKRKVYLAYHGDGILDLAGGSVMLGFGADMLTGNIAFLMASWLMIMMYFALKQRITIPRFGYVRFEPEKKTIAKGFAGVGIGVLVLFLILALNFFIRSDPTSPETKAWIQRYHMVPLSGMLFGLPALAAALFLGLKRFYLYALLAVGLPALGAWLNSETYLPIMTTGLIVLGYGAVLLIGFLKNYPLNNEADADVSE